MNRDLPVVINAGTYHSQKFFPNLLKSSPRTVDCFELEFFFSDSGIAVINGVEHPLRRGNLLVAKAGDVRYSHLPFQCKFVHFTFNGSPDISAALEQLPAFFPAPNPQKAETTISEIATLFHSASKFDNLCAGAKLLMFLHSLCTAPGQRAEFITAAQRYIEENFHYHITVEDIAKSCSVSPSYLHKCFKMQLHTTPGEYLLNHRLKVARELLTNSSHPLSSIALDCGFTSQSYFSDCFKRNIGMTPKKYRDTAGYPLEETAEYE